eukprot:TRINITY_DN10778_c0_g2_i1.p1 TRINITY_DN10778_c0_g2~~TRINITY_DN10778_c0_g2_i1.p1  ORF type:complete len:1337 (+),score=199.00 TRINITY_DN10778_c0_g2_i1:13-4023(+)
MLVFIFVLLQLIQLCPGSELLFKSESQRRCRDGIGTNTLTGCVEWTEIGIRGFSENIPTSITLAPRGGDAEDDQIDCKIKTSNATEVWCTIDRVPAGSASEFLIQFDGMATVPSLHVEVSPTPIVSSVRYDSDLCTSLPSEKLSVPSKQTVTSCEKGALIVIKGKSLRDTNQISLTSPSCSEHVGCSIQHVTKSRVTCTVAELENAVSKCSVNDMFPVMKLSLSTHSISSMEVNDGDSIGLVSIPVISSLEYHSGCTSGSGSRQLFGCRDGAEITIRGTSLNHYNDTVVLMSPKIRSRHSARANCRVVSATFSIITCTLHSEAEGHFNLYVVSLGGRSEEPVTISIAPFPALHNITYEKGCLAGNETLDLVCGNRMELMFHGTGFVAETEVMFSDNRCRCVEGHVTDYLTPIELTTGTIPVSTEYYCLLSCEPDLSLTSPLRVIVSVQTGNTPAKELGSLAIILQPQITNISFVENTDGQTCQPPVGLSQPTNIVLTNCTNKAVLIISGENLISNHTHVHLFAVDDNGKPIPGGIEQTVSCRSLGGTNTESDNTTSGGTVAAAAFVSEQYRCQLEYSSLPVSNCFTYAIIASSIGGYSTTTVDYEPKSAPKTIREDAYSHLLRSERTGPLITLLPQPTIDKLSNCLQQRKGTLLEICTVIDTGTITIHGEGYLPNSVVKLRPASEGEGKERPCTITAITDTEISCNTTTDADQLQPATAFDIIVVSSGGVAVLPNSLILIPRPRINGLSGCTLPSGQNTTFRCKHGDRLTISGAGFSPENTTVELIPSSNESTPVNSSVKLVSVVLAQSTEVVVETLQQDGEGLYNLWVHSEGGSLLSTTVELIPLPTFQKVRNVNCIKTAKRAASCPRGGVIEIHGTNFVDIKAVQFHKHGDHNQSLTNPPCDVMNHTRTLITCKASHTIEHGSFFPVVETIGGETRWDPQAHSHSVIELIPLPVITSLFYNKAGHCLEGNGTTELSGCKSGTAITITGNHLDEQGAQVLLSPGKAGGRNGPPECWIISITNTQIQCVLDHTSAAGAFDLSVRHIRGESEVFRVSVIPGNLYLLFKNTKVVLAISNVVGWICACVWTGSLATLAVSNELAQSTAGVAPDMVLYNALGLLCWTIYSIYFYVNSELGVPVFVQDIVYSVTSYMVVIVFMFQICRFGSTGITTFAKLYCFGLLSFLAKAALENVVSTSATNALFVSQLARIHLACALIKYIPQVHYNYTRKSTEGYSITAVWLDFSGAVLLLLQMFFDGIIRHKWSLMITLNIPKFVLCCEVILFNLIYAFQHYILYGAKTVATGGSESALFEKPLCITVSDVMPIKRRNQTSDSDGS